MTRATRARLKRIGASPKKAIKIAHDNNPLVTIGQQQRDCRVDIEMAEGPTVGRTTIDWWGRGKAAPNAHVIESLDADEMFARIATAVHTLD